MTCSGPIKSSGVNPGYSTKATVCCSPHHLRLSLEHIEAEHHAALNVLGRCGSEPSSVGAVDIE
jgi:hypothetical protein